MARTRAKPRLWRANPTLVDPAFRWAWRGRGLWWMFFEGAGPVINHHWPGRNDGTLVNGPTWGVNEVGTVMNFTSASNHYVDCGGSPPVEAYPFTLIGYVKGDGSGNDRTIVSIADVSAAGRYANLRWTSGSSRWVLERRDGGTADFCGAGPETSEMQLVVGVAKGDTDAELWLDGILVDTSSTSRAFQGNLIDTTGIGRSMDSSASWYFGGAISYAAVLPWALTPSEIERLWADPFGPFRPARRVPRRAFAAPVTPSTPQTVVEITHTFA